MSNGEILATLADMPITDMIDPVYDAPEGVADHTAEVYAEVLKHVRDVREVRARGGRGTRGGRPRILVPTQRFVLDIDEDPAELARAVARKMLQQIMDDAAGDGWRGAVELVGDPDEKSKPVILGVVKIELSAGTPMPKSTREDEIVGLVGALSKTIAEMGSVVVRVGSTKADEIAAYASMVSALSETLRASGKWEYKKHKETEETERVREEAQARASQTRARWAAFETFAEEWSGVAQIWSQYFAAGGKNVPKRPTQEELRKVFDAPDLTIDGRPWSEVFDPMRAIVSQMLAETDVRERCRMAKEDLMDMVNALPATTQQALKMRMGMVLGEARALEIAAWLTMPIT